MKNMEELANQIERKTQFNFHLKLVIDELKNFQGEEWRQCSCDHETNYERYLMVSRDKFDIFVLTWKPGVATKIHNHPQTGCIYKLVSGNLVEELFDTTTLNQTKSTPLSIGDTGYIDDTIGYHSIKNPGLTPAVSIHIYQKNYVPHCFN